MLYAPELFEPLTETPWDEARARAAIQAIVADADAAYTDRALWPAHEWDGWRAALPLKNLYVGAAGVAWALDRLREHGFADVRLDPADVARRALEAFRASPDFMAGEDMPQRHSALLVGETGIVLVAQLLDPDAVHEDDLLDLIRQNVGNNANELMWGVPGTLLAARAMLARTDDEWWSTAVTESEDAVRDARDEDGLWTQSLHGETFRSLTPPHGLTGNVVALGEPENAAEILRERATVEDGRANWISTDGVGRLQWCAGAPGILVAAAAYLDEELVLAAAELVWEAGAPVDEKGAGICHGTAGNGYALLKTFERTGDELWLARARAFAVHAHEQAQRLPGRYSLFTGGVGAALFAADCVAGRARYPVLDGF